MVSWKAVTGSIKTVMGGAFAALIIRLLSATIRWEYLNLSGLPLGAGGSPGIVIFWHGRLLMMPKQYFRVRGRRAEPPYVLISLHGDGRLIAFAIRLFGIRSVAGSSSRGGSKAMLQMIDLAQRGLDLGITPDGPRGPRYECKEGVVLLAQKTGLPIYPISYSTKRRWKLGSWDEMIIPKPFSPGVVVVGEPICVDESEDIEQMRIKIQDALRQITERADGHWASL